MKTPLRVLIVEDSEADSLIVVELDLVLQYHNAETSSTPRGDPPSKGLDSRRFDGRLKYGCP